MKRKPILIHPHDFVNNAVVVGRYRRPVFPSPYLIRPKKQEDNHVFRVEKNMDFFL